MSTFGGPIARLEHSWANVFGCPCAHAVSYLDEGIVDSANLKARATDQPDGAGCHSSAQIACYMAISEALERWAVYFCRQQEDSSMGGIGLDGSSNGFAAYPGLYRRQARRAAYRESIERHCLICWWEGLLGHRCIEDPWPGVTAIRIDNPFSKHAVVLLWSITVSGHSFAFGAGDDVAHASRRALVELERTQSLLLQLASQVKHPGSHGDLFERRIHYFSTEAGAKRFLKRLKHGVRAAPPRLKLKYDAPVIGPWDAYASVWRTIIEAPSRAYLSDEDDYFFW